MNALVEQIESKIATRNLEKQTLDDEINRWIDENKNLWRDKVVIAFNNLSKWKKYDENTESDDEYKENAESNNECEDKIQNLQFNYKIFINVPNYKYLQKNVSRNIACLICKELQIQYIKEFTVDTGFHITFSYIANIDSKLIFNVLQLNINEAMSTFEDFNNWNFPDVESDESHCYCEYTFNCNRLFQPNLKNMIEQKLFNSKFSVKFILSYNGLKCKLSYHF